MIDWDLAVSAASRLAGPGPTITPPEADAVVAELEADADRSDRRWCASSPAWRPPSARRRCWSSTAPAGSRPTPTASPTSWARWSRSCRPSKGAPTPSPRRSARRVTGLEVGGLLGFMSVEGARPVRPVLLRPGLDGGAPAAGRLLLVAPEHRARRERAAASTAATSGSGCACTRRPTGCSSPRCPGCATTSTARSTSWSAPSTSTRARSPRCSATAVKRIGDVVRGEDDVSLLDLFSTPEQRVVMDRLTGVMSLLEGHADVVMDGVGPAVIPSVDDIRAQVQPAPQGRRLRSTGCCAGCSASTPRWRSTATAPPSCARVVDQVGMDGFNAVWAEPANLPVQGRDRRPGRLGRAACTADACRHVARPRRRRGPARRTTGARRRRSGGPVARRLLRRRRLARAAGRHRLRGAPKRWHVVGVTVDHGLQDGSAEHADRVVAQMAALGVDETVVGRGSTSTAAARGPRRRPARRGTPCWREVARAVRVATSCCSGTRSTTRPRPCCSGWPAARAAARWPGCAAASTSTAARCST